MADHPRGGGPEPHRHSIAVKAVRIADDMDGRLVDEGTQKRGQHLVAFAHSRFGTRRACSPGASVSRVGPAPARASCARARQEVDADGWRVNSRPGPRRARWPTGGTAKVTAR